MTASDAWRRRLTAAAKALVLLAAFGFLVHTLLQGRHELAGALTRPRPGVLVVLVLAALGATGWAGWGWLRTLRALDAHLPAVRGLALFGVVEVTKYLPGMLWASVGRAEAVVREGVARPVAYAGVLLALGINYVLAGPMAAGVVAPAVAADLATAPRGILLLLLALPAGLVALHPAVQRRVVALLGRRSGLDGGPVLPWSAAVRLAVFHLPVWVGVATATTAGAALLGVPLTPGLVGLLTVAAALSWTAGFLALPAPAGLGVREAVFVLLAGPSVGVDVAAAVAVLSRLAFVVADGVLAAGGLLVLRRLRRMGGVRRSAHG